MFALALAISNLPLLEAALITWSPYKVTPYATARPQVLSYATPLQIAKVRKCSGWQELNLRGHVPKTCGWPLVVPAQATVSDPLVRSPAQALRIHTHELGGVVLGGRTAPAPPIPKQTPEARATALRPDLG